MIMVQTNTSEEYAMSLVEFTGWLENKGIPVPLGFQFDYREKIWTVIPGPAGTRKVQRSLENGKFMTLEFHFPKDSQDVVVQLVPVDGLVTTLERVLVGIGKFHPGVSTTLNWFGLILLKDHDSPTLKELGEVVGVSTSTAHKYVQRLRKLGLLYPRQGGYVDRDIWLTPAGYAVLEALT